MRRPKRPHLRCAGGAFLGALLLVVGCSAPGAPRESSRMAVATGGFMSVGVAPDPEMVLSAEASVEEMGIELAATDPAGPSPLPAAGERLLIYSGRFSVAVPSVEEAIEGARRMSDRLGGWVQALRDDTIVIRVPAARWEESLAGLRDLGRILSRAIEAQDVTEEVVDLHLRLRNAQVLRKRLEELLAQAETVEVTLKVETELNRIRTEIERLEGRLQKLSDRVAFSTLTIGFVPVQQAPTRLQALPFPWLRELGLEGLLGLRGGVR